MLVDVTDRRRVHELRHELASERAQNLRLSAADDAKTIALQAVSHDIRTPLAAILGLAITLENRADEMSADEVRDLSSRIVANSRRLDRIVTDLLDLDRLQRDGFSARLEDLDLGALIRQLVTRRKRSRSGASSSIPDRSTSRPTRRWSSGSSRTS